MVYLAPGDAAEVMAGPQASREDIGALRQRLGLDQPVWVQYGRFLGRLVHGDLGTSVRSSQDVASMILVRYPNTLRLALAATLVGTVAGVALGAISAARKGSWADHAVTVGTVVGLSVPGFWLGLILVLFFAVRLRVLPVAGLASPAWSWAGLKSLVLPSISLGTALLATVARLTRSAMLDVLAQDYVRTARAKGPNEATVTFRHALRNALIAVTTVVGLNLGALLGGAVVTESVFAINGVGRLVVEAILARDFPVIQGGVLLIATTFVVVNLLVDTTYALLDPRIRYE